MANSRYSGTTLVTTIFVLSTFTLAIVALRIWFRVTRRMFDRSDLLLLGGVLCGMIQSIDYLLLVLNFSYGKLKANIPPEIRSSESPAKILFTNHIIAKLTMPLCKLSLCSLYLSICSRSTGRMIRNTSRAIWVTIILIIGMYGSAIIAAVLQCLPVRKIWSPHTPGTCMNVVAFCYATAFFNTITSVMIITLPIPMLLKLKTQRPEIKQLIGLILLGLLHTSLTVARSVLMFHPDPLVEKEPQYGYMPSYNLTIGEMNAHVMFASLVVMRPAFQALYHVFVPQNEASCSPKPRVEHGSTLIRFRAALEKKRKKRVSETYILEGTDPGSVRNQDDLTGGGSTPCLLRSDKDITVFRVISLTERGEMAEVIVVGGDASKDGL